MDFICMNATCGGKRSPNGRGRRRPARAASSALDPCHRFGARATQPVEVISARVSPCASVRAPAVARSSAQPDRSKASPGDSAPPVVATKLRAPSVRDEVVARERLTQLLDAAAERRLTVVAAPTRYGKTTPLAQWLSRFPRARGWVSPLQTYN